MGDNGETQVFEYMTFDLAKPKRDVEGLNRLGRDGWEAVAMVSSWGVGWRFVHPIVLLKRRVRTVLGKTSVGLG
jgi:hypothetical protein